MTRTLYAIIGDPIAQARSPEVFNQLFAQRGIDAEMVALHVGADQFETALQGLAALRNFGGAVITIPHKAAAARVAVQRSARVAVAGVANVLRPGASGWRADLFDGEGFVAGLRQCGHEVRVQSAAVVGAGGAGMAIATALLDAGVGSVAIDDIDRVRAEDACTRLSATYGGRVQRRGPTKADNLVVNATPIGMNEGDALPVVLEQLDPRALVADAIMKPPRTRLLTEAVRRGHPVQEGRHMLDGQAEAIWRFLAMGGAASDPPGVPSPQAPP
ncbi:shikimate dehydrogenase family protein [Variovorax terrae]|uniref:Shikimate dehydrogenase n=1 Tax=Variovorax terrae TaxID=2923278 RepID=A0A9X2AT33_9BURK|nr:shikimate dehydrogenase [Variovorax terrae]MCJ0765951.1 shikimate dehydrogenase [Variovorax terrae]